MTMLLNPLTFTTAITLLALGAGAQAEPIDLNPDALTLIGGAVIEEHAGRRALALGRAESGAPFGFGAAVLKDVFLENGTIEYDVMFGETRTFAGLMFRAQGPEDAEEFYMRAHQSGNPDANQYMPRYNGVPSWQLYYGPQYAVPMAYDFDTWTHVKLEVVDARADIYIGDMSAPALAVDLVRDPAIGGLSLWGLNLGGEAWFSNIDVTPTETIELSGTPVAPVEAGPGAVMSWKVSDAFDGKILTGTTLPDALPLAAHSLSADTNGMANLARLQGVAEGADTVLTQVVVSSETDMTVPFNLGFSDDAKVYLNGKLLFSGSDRYTTRDYRFLGTVGLWYTVILPLQEGENTLTIAVTEDVADKTGWAVMGQFEQTEGLSWN
jgi:hypothetical protein